jgi:hypothetical protein
MDRVADADTRGRPEQGDESKHHESSKPHISGSIVAPLTIIHRATPSSTGRIVEWTAARDTMSLQLLK